MEYVLERLKERTTWLGLTALVSAFGVALAPELVEAIVSFGIAAAGLVAVLFPENGKIAGK